MIITAITAQQASQNIIEQVRALINAGVPAKSGNGLLPQLERIIDKINRGKIDDAISQLQSVVTHVQDLIATGVLTSAQGQPLIDAASRIIASLQPTGLPKLAVNALPTEHALEQNYPNPFNPSTTISFETPRRGNVAVNICNSLGQLVRELVNEQRDAGTHSVVWDGRDNTCTGVSSGAYFYQEQIGEFSQAKGMILLK